MQIPSTIKIGGLIYDVKIVGTDLLPNEAGNIETTKKLIRILESSEDFMFVTLLHEVLHAINMEMPEERIEFLAQALYQVIADNPIIFSAKEKTKEKIPVKKVGVNNGRSQK